MSEWFTTTNSGEQCYVDTYTYDNVGNQLTKTHVVGTSTLSITDTYDSHGDNCLMTEMATGTGAYSTSHSYDTNGFWIRAIPSIRPLNGGTRRLKPPRRGKIEGSVQSS
ncbi:MAG TPA: hypothetical protein VHX86_11875 [Tepidisphaeraceae bacterium]|nr:hypothetical protein [Tepidisphaeraceae bacterium]